jgi:CO/xanthine dehydrogenase Mo-binding subunit
MTQLANLSRRGFVKALGIASGTLVLGAPDLLEAQAAPGPARFGAMLAIAADGAVTVVCPSSEMGQGTHEALARLIGEELDCDWSRLSVAQPWADTAFNNPAARKQITANSMTVTGYYQSLRKLGASARAMLVKAAADRLGVPASDLATEGGMVRHAASGKSLSYGELAAAAAALPVPGDVPLKAAKDFRLIGTRSPRKDLAAKVTGRAEYGIDVHEEGMLVAALSLAPHPAATFTVTGMETARAMPGVVAVLQVKGGVAVIADRFWRAQRAAQTLALTVTASPIAGLDTAMIAAKMEGAFAAGEGQPFPDVDLSVSPPKITPGDPSAVAAAMAGAARKLNLQYDVPYLAHAAMEPLCCAARFDTDKLLVRGPLQAPEAAREVAAAKSGLPLSSVRVEMTFIGGGFGRKWANDFVELAVEIAMAAPGRMVKTIWTREQDFAVDQFRPAYSARYEVGLAADGSIAAMHGRIAGQSINAYHGRKGPPGIGDPTAAGWLIYGVYAFPNKLIHYHPVDLTVPVGFWRSVTMSQNSFFAESVIDEVAHETGRDPLAMRLALLAQQPRMQAVLERAGAMIGWDKPRRKGTGRGIALAYADNSACAQAVEVEIKGKQLKINRIVCAMDCGLAIDPPGVEAQISGGIVFGLQAALYGEVPFAAGAPQISNFSDYRMPLLGDTPPIEVALLAGSDRPGSVGESSVPPLAPALTNAIANAGGPRIRRLPVSKTLEV